MPSKRSYKIGERVNVTNSKTGVSHPGHVDWISENNGTVQVALIGGGYGYIDPDNHQWVIFSYEPSLPALSLAG